MQEKPQYLIDLAVRQTWHKMSRMYNQKANIYDLSMSMGYILLHVDKEGTPSTQLGPRMGMEPTSLSRTLKTMEDKGYIKRQEDKNDKRVVRIFLTDLGLEGRHIARGVIFDFNNKVVERVGIEKLLIFQEVIDEVQQLLQDEFDVPVD